MGVMKEYEGLAKVTDINEGNLGNVSRHIQEYIETENSNVLQAIANDLKARPGLIGVLFPGKFQTTIDGLKIQQIENLFKNRQDLLAAYTNVRLESIKIQGENHIISMTQGFTKILTEQAMQIRSELTAFSQSKINEMSERFRDSRREFVQRIKEQEQEAEACKEIPYLYGEYKDSLKHEAKVFFTTIANILNGFIKDLEDKLEGLRKEKTI
jgi:hypothetical protein